MGNSQDSIHDFLPFVEREWPEFFVSRFRALLLQFDRALGQFPNYRSYEDYRRKDVLTEAQMMRASAVSKTVAEALENDDIQGWLDPAIANALRVLEEPLALADGQARLTSSIVGGLLESLSNILKGLLERLTEWLGLTVYWTQSTAIGCGTAYAEGAKESLIKEAGKAGDNVGRSVGRLLKGLGAAVILGGGGLAAAPLMTVLTQDFPAVFGWLKSFRSLIERL